jgi:hypothetical protein
MPRFLAFRIVLAAAVVALNAAAASAQDLSPGCQLLNDPSWEAGLPHSGGGFPRAPQPFAAGELITTSAGEPTLNGTPTTVTLIVNDVVVDTAPFPGTVQYVIPAEGQYTVAWTVDMGNNTWSISCEAPLVDPAQAIADLRAMVTGLSIHHGIATALNSKLQDALAALNVGDTAGACDSLQAFLNQVRAQNGKKLTSAQAEGLTDAANDIRALLGC